jgi:hypothetical protein
MSCNSSKQPTAEKLRVGARFTTCAGRRREPQRHRRPEGDREYLPEFILPAVDQ